MGSSPVEAWTIQASFLHVIAKITAHLRDFCFTWRVYSVLYNVLLIVYLICIYLIGPNSIHHWILCRQLDRDNLGVIKRYQFKELLEARFKMKVTDDELTSVLRPLLEDTNHSLIPYARFLELFSSPRCSMFFFSFNCCWKANWMSDCFKS